MMRPEGVPDELVERAMLAWHRGVEGGDDDCDCLADSDVIDEYRKAMRGVLAAVLPDIWAEAADFLRHGDENGVGASMVGAARLTMRARADRLTETTEEEEK